MALPASGPLSLLQIATEFGGAAPHSLSEYYGAAPGVPTSGAISIGHFYGKGREFAFTRTISADVFNYNLRAQAVAAGWDQSARLVANITIAAGVVVSANATNIHAFDTGSGFPAGSTLSLTNHGHIIGMGGAGGSWTNTIVEAAAGGPALIARAALSVNNQGTIGGGGGGGGRGGSSSYGTHGGSGGRTGRQNSAAGIGFQSSGNPGTFASAGAKNDTYAGSGGNWGTAGEIGHDASSGGKYPAGAAGAAVVGNANITWAAAGTRLGAIT